MNALFTTAGIVSSDDIRSFIEVTLPEMSIFSMETINVSIIACLIISLISATFLRIGRGKVLSGLFTLFNYLCVVILVGSLYKLLSMHADKKHGIEGPNTASVQRAYFCIALFTAACLLGISLIKKTIESRSSTKGYGIITISLLCINIYLIFKLDQIALFSVGTIVLTILCCELVVKSSSVDDEKTRTPDDFNGPNSLKSLSTMFNNKDMTIAPTQVKDNIDVIDDLFDGMAAKGVDVSKAGKVSSSESIKKRQDEYASMVDKFYNLVTDFYQYGWGQSFHFAPRYVGETFRESIRRAEYHLALRIGADPSFRILDVGCGIGGPLRNIAKHTGASITGVTINEYQVKVGNRYLEMEGLKDQGCKLIQGDFMKLDDKFEPEMFDGAYQIEATCHAPDKVKCFKQIAKTLKPGAIFTGYEWVVTKNYDAKNKEHVKLREGIEVGNGLPTLATGPEVNSSLEEAGFEVVFAGDANARQNDPNQIPWYRTLKGEYSFTGFRMTPIGRSCTHTLVQLLEFLRIAPAGSVRVSAMLNATANDIVRAGDLGIFTPSYLFVARKK